MKNYKKFVKLVVLMLMLMVMFHMIVWNIYVSKVNNNSLQYNVGDLSRMSYHLDTIFLRESKINLAKKHINFNDYNKTKIDILTIGDSFSNAGGGGTNPYYQDYIATNNNKEVLNILQIPNTNNYIESIVLLYNTGYLEKLGVKTVLVESVQRLALDRFTKKIDFDLNKNIDIYDTIVNTYDIYHPKEKDKQKISMINNLNFNALLYNIKFQIKGYGKGKSFYIEKLKSNLFTSKVQNELIFHKNDIKMIEAENRNRIKSMNDNFNSLGRLLALKGIKLYFMPVVDKFNLYNNYIISHKYQKSHFFEYLRELPKDYNLIDTKKILTKELEQGVKDIFFSDDTHWNYKASKAIFDKIKF